VSEAEKAHRERVRRLNLAVAQKLREAHRDLGRLHRALPRAAGMALGRERDYLEQVGERLRRGCSREFSEAHRRIQELHTRVLSQARAFLAREAHRLSDREKRLKALDPRRVLERGYAIIRRVGDGIVTDPAQAPPGTRLRAELRGGVLRLLSQGGEREDGR